MRRFGAGGLLLLVTAVASSTALAFPSSRLVYVRGDGADSCPAEAVVRKAVALRLGYDPFFPTAPKTMLAEIGRDRDRLRGRVALVDETGRMQGAREFRTSLTHCEDLVAVMALAMSIAIDPSAATAEPAPAQPPSTAPVEVPVPKDGSAAHPAAPANSPEPKTPPKPKQDANADVLPASRPTIANPRKLVARASLSAAGSLGTAPEMAAAIAAAIGVRWSAFSVALEGRHDWPGSTAILGGGSIVTSLWAGSLVPCWHPSALVLCGVGTVGSIHGSGEGLVTPRASDAPYAALGLRTGIEIELGGPLFLRPQLDLMANLARPELQVDGAIVWKTSAVSALFGAALLANLP